MEMQRPKPTRIYISNIYIPTIFKSSNLRWTHSTLKWFICRVSSWWRCRWSGRWYRFHVIIKKPMPMLEIDDGQNFRTPLDGQKWRMVWYWFATSIAYNNKKRKWSHLICGHWPCAADQIGIGVLGPAGSHPTESNQMVYPFKVDLHAKSNVCVYYVDKQCATHRPVPVTSTQTETPRLGSTHARMMYHAANDVMTANRWPNKFKLKP